MKREDDRLDRDPGDDATDDEGLDAVELDREEGRKEAPLADDPSERVRPIDE
jgi:hypothetical protein